METNTSLTSLDIEYNHTGPEGIQTIAKAMQHNSTIIYLGGKFKHHPVVQVKLQENLDLLCSRCMYLSNGERLSNDKLHQMKNQLQSKHSPEDLKE